jgi:hypothetical protein
MTFTATRVYIVAFCIAALSLAALSLAFGQADDPDAKTYSLKRITPKYSGGDPHEEYAYYNEDYADDWVKTSEKSSVLFLHLRGWKGSGMPVNSILYSFQINKRGGFSTISEVWSFIGGDILDVEALWIKGGGAGTPAAGEGVIFIAYTSADDGSKTTKLAVANFDAGGKLASTFQDLDEIHVKDNQDFCVNARIAAAYVEGRIGVAFSAVFYRQDTATLYGVTGSAMHFLETDISGKLIKTNAPATGIVDIKLGGNGSYQEVYPSTPLWTGRRWLLSVRHILVAPGTQTSKGGYYLFTTGTKFTTLTVEPTKASTVKVRWHKIVYKATENANGILSPQVLALPSQTAGGPSAKPNYVCAYLQIVDIPESKRELDAADLYYSLAPISDKGKLLGPPRVIELPKWNHKIEYDPNGNLAVGRYSVSFPVLDDDGNIVISLARGLRWDIGGIWNYENLFELFSVNPITSELTTLAREDANLTWQVRLPQIIFMKGSICVLNQVLLIPQSLPSEFAVYFSKF